MPGGRLVESQKDRAQLSGGTKALASTISLSHPPDESPQGTSSRHQTSLHPANTQCHASVDTSLLGASLPPGASGPSHRGPPTAKQAKPGPPATVHLVDPPCLIRPWPDPIKAAPQALQYASSPDRGHTTPVSPAPKRGEDKVHTSLTSYSGEHSGSYQQDKLLWRAQWKCPAVWRYRRIYPK